MTTTVLAVGAVAYSAFNTAWRLLTGHEWNNSAPSANNDNSVVAAPLEEVKLEEPESFEGSDFYTEIHSNSPSVRGLVLPNDSPFERRYLPTGIDINSPFVREVVLPMTDHNCALFGIYGRNDVTRDEVIAELVGAGAPNAATGNAMQTDLGIRIRNLMAPEILAYLLETQPETRERAAAMQLLAGGNPVILNLLSNLFQQYEANPTDENRIKLLKTLADAKIFQNYVRQVLGKRIGASDEDPYPMLGYIPGDTATRGMTGALPAIAAMRGVVTLNVHQRQGRDIVQVAGYVQDPRLTPQGNHQVVDLLHTTADVNNPGVLNHFNRLLRYERREEFFDFLNTDQVDSSDPMNYIRMFYIFQKMSGGCELSYIAWNDKVCKWILKLGLTKALIDNKLMVIFESNNNSFNCKLDKTLSLLFKTFHDVARALGEKEKKVIGGFLSNYKAQPLYKTMCAKNDLTPQQWCSEFVEDFQEGVVNDTEPMDIFFTIGIEMNPSMKNLQFLILVIDEFLHLRKPVLDRLPNAIAKSMDKKFSHVDLATYTFFSDRVKELAVMIDRASKNEIIVWRYILDQLIAFCRMHGVEPVVPHYDPKPSDEQDRDLQDLLRFINEEENIVGEIIVEEAPVPKKQNKKKKNRKNRKKKTAVINPDSNANDRIESPIIPLEVETESKDEEIVVEPEEEAVLEASLDAQVVLDEENEDGAEAEEVENEDFDLEALETMWAEMRAKKLKQLQQPKLQRPSLGAPIEDIVVLMPDERVQFLTYLEGRMTDHEARIYNAFLNAEHMALTLDEIEQFADFVTKYLRSFLTSQVYANGGRMYSNAAIGIFIESLLSDHKKSFHNFHAVKGKKVPSQWIKYRRGSWIAHGILSVMGATRTDQTAHANYQAGLMRRGGQ